MSSGVQPIGNTGVSMGNNGITTAIIAALQLIECEATGSGFVIEADKPQVAQFNTLVAGLAVRSGKNNNLIIFADLDQNNCFWSKSKKILKFRPPETLGKCILRRLFYKIPGKLHFI